MPAGRWGADDGSADGWNDDVPWGDPDEALEHEIALAAALDQSRTDLSLDRDSAVRMRADFFATLEAEWNPGPQAPARPVFVDPSRTDPAARVDPAAAETTVLRPIAEPIAETAHERTADLTAALRPEGPAAATRAEATPGERVLAGSAAQAGGNRRSRRSRHVLPADHPDNPGRGIGARGPGGRRPSLRKRVALVGGAAALALVALAGGTAAMSGGALPGDALYGVKLAAESTGTAFTFGDAARAQRQLDVASTRLTEVEQLQKAGRTPDPQTYQTAMTAFDTAASEGSRLALAGAQPPTETGLGDLDTWAKQQSAAITAIQSTGTVPGADKSAKLLKRMSDRAAALQARMGCTEVSSGVDDLGPIPATGTCTPAPLAGSTGSGSRTSVDRSTPQSAHSGSSSTAPSSAAGTSGTTTPGPLDGLVGGSSATTTDGSADPSASTSASATPSSTDKPGGGGGLLPPISLPPLLPGLPSITIG